MKDSHDEERDDKDTPDPPLLEPDAAADAVIEITSEVGISISQEEAIRVAKEVLEEHTSPLLIAAGASGSVTITTSPAGDVETARSVKARNILFLT